MDLNSVLQQNLAPAQLAAATDDNVEILCLACAGSGKSRTLAFRIARLIAEGVEPSSIVAFTFTEKAAESIKRRVASAFVSLNIPATVLGAIYIGTIHSFCQELLDRVDARYRQFDVLDENRLCLYLMSRYEKIGIKSIRDERGKGYFETIRQVANAWKTANDEMIDLDQIKAEDNTLGTILLELKSSLFANQYLDFSMMIRNSVDALLNKNPNIMEEIGRITNLLVDEYQDVNPSQEALISQIRSNGASLFVVGDDDQSIYGWRGADISNILDFTSRYKQASQHTISINYRSTSAIVNTADQFAAAELGATRYDKTPVAHEDMSPRDYRKLWFEDRDSEANWVADQIQNLIGTKFIEENGEERGLTPADFTILMRSTVGSGEVPRHRPFSSALESRGIKVNIENGGRPFDRPQVSVIRDILELLRSNNPTRSEVRDLYESDIQVAYPESNFAKLANVLAEWGVKIHSPQGGARQRLYPQLILQQILESLGLSASRFSDNILQDIGVLSRIMQDVETVYLSVDSQYRFSTVLNFLNHVAETGYDSNNSDLVQKPDAVSILTIHKAKGLEFPVVFVTDVEQGRFPGSRSSYRGWLPNSVISKAITRGAYQSTRSEEARAFYTALTRAERYLYISGAADIGGKKLRKPSQFSLRLQHEELLEVPGLPQGLEQHPEKRRIDENIVPTSFSEIRYYLRCPYDYKLRKIYGFSPAITEMFGFGQTVHASISKIHEAFPAIIPTKEDAETIARDMFHLKHIPPSSDPINSPGGYEAAKSASCKIAREYVEKYSDDFTHSRQVEARFEIPADQTVISGAIDLLLKEDSSGNILDASVIDFKSMEAGKDPLNNPILDWTELSLQVQLYAKAAKDVLGERAKTGKVHLLKDQVRLEVPIDDEAQENAVANVEWAISKILNQEFPRRPHREKCKDCDFNSLCPKTSEDFSDDLLPPEISTPNGKKFARAISLFSENE